MRISAPQMATKMMCIYDYNIFVSFAFENDLLHFSLLNMMGYIIHIHAKMNPYNNYIPFTHHLFYYCVYLLFSHRYHKEICENRCPI